MMLSFFWCGSKNRSFSSDDSSGAEIMAHIHVIGFFSHFTRPDIPNAFMVHFRRSIVKSTEVYITNRRAMRLQDRKLDTNYFRYLGVILLSSHRSNINFRKNSVIWRKETLIIWLLLRKKALIGGISLRNSASELLCRIVMLLNVNHGLQ